MWRYRHTSTPVGKIYSIPKENWNEVDVDEIVLCHKMLVIDWAKRRDWVRVATVIHQPFLYSDP